MRPLTRSGSAFSLDACWLELEPDHDAAVMTMLEDFQQPRGVAWFASTQVEAPCAPAVARAHSSKVGKRCEDVMLAGDGSCFAGLLHNKNSTERRPPPSMACSSTSTTAEKYPTRQIGSEA